MESKCQIQNIMTYMRTQQMLATMMVVYHVIMEYVMVMQCRKQQAGMAIIHIWYIQVIHGSCAGAAIAIVLLLGFSTVAAVVVLVTTLILPVLSVLGSSEATSLFCAVVKLTRNEI